MFGRVRAGEAHGTIPERKEGAMTQAQETRAHTSPGDGAPVTEQAQEKVKEGAQAAREQAQSAAQQAQARAREQVDQRTTEAGERLQTTAGDARSMAEHLRREGKDGPARLAEQAADRADSIGGYLSEADADRLIRDVERLARKNPWAVMAGGLALGFAASRFVSASSASRSLHDGEGRAESRPQLPARPAADAPRAAADAAVGEPYGGNGGATPAVRPASADLPNYGGSPS
jgi:hypothetical protein